MEEHMRSIFAALLADESGQGLVEYALIIALVAVGLIAILLVLRNSIGNVFKNAASQLNNAPTAPMAP
jgi:pilus assembly protein Flp/PilA